MCHCELPASGFVATRFGDQSGALDVARRLARQVFRNNSSQGRTNDCLSRFLTRRR